MLIRISPSKPFVVGMTFRVTSEVSKRGASIRQVTLTRVFPVKMHNNACMQGIITPRIPKWKFGNSRIPEFKIVMKQPRS